MQMVCQCRLSTVWPVDFDSRENDLNMKYSVSDVWFEYDQRCSLCCEISDGGLF